MIACVAASLPPLLGSSPSGEVPAGELIAGMPGGMELWVILFIVLILFGRRLPGVARSLGQGISSFKKGLNEPVEADDLEPKGDEPQGDKAKADTSKVASGSESDA